MRIKDTFYYVMLIYFTERSLCRGLNLEEHWNQFLIDSFQNVNRELNLKLKSTEDFEPTSIDFKINHHIVFQDVIKATFVLFGKLYLIMDGKLFYMVPGYKERLFFDEISLPNANVTFAKAFEHDSCGYVVIGYTSGLCCLYKKQKNGFEYIQTINTGSYIRDAIMLFKRNVTHLLVLNDCCTIYKWNEAHFDEIANVEVKEAITVESFQDQNVDIIVILVDSKESQELSVVYEFNGVSLTKTQYLDILRPRDLVSFSVKNQTYVAVFGELSTLYIWKGGELIILKEYNNIEIIIKAAVSYADGSPIVFAATNGDIKAMSFKQTQLEILSSIKTLGNGVLDLYLMDEQHALYIMFHKATKETGFAEIIFGINLEITEKSSKNEDDLIQCFHDLEIYTLVNITHGLNKRDIVHTNAQRLRNTNIVFPDNFFSTDYQKKSMELNNRIEQVQNNISLMKDYITKLFNMNHMILNGNLKLTGNLYVSKLTTSLTHLSKLNGIEWHPDVWLSTNKPQNITGPVWLKRLVSKKFKVPKINAIFKDFLLSKGTQRLVGFDMIRSISALKMTTPTINNVPFEDMYLRKKGNKILGMKQFTFLETRNLYTMTMNDHKASDILQIFGQSVPMSPTMFVKNLKILKLNGVEWHSFKQSVLKKNEPFKIAGNVNFTNIFTNMLFAKQICGTDVDNFLTTLTNQTISSYIHFKVLHAENIKAEIVNKLDLPNDVAMFNTSSNEILGPISVKHMKVRKSFHVLGVVDKTNMRKDNETSTSKIFEERFLGSNESDLLQIYRRKIKIIGDVTVKNLYFFNKAKTFIDGQKFNWHIPKKYWMKNIYQKIPVFFEAQKGITCTQLLTKFLNNIRLTDYILRTQEMVSSTNFHFNKVFVTENIHLNHESENSPDLKKVDEESLKLSGRSYNVTGKKFFKGSVLVENLNVKSLNKMPVSNFITKNTNGNIGATIFENIILKNDLKVKTVSVPKINSIDINRIYNEVSLMDKRNIDKRLNFQEISVDKLYVKKLNGHIFNDYIRILSEMENMDTLNQVKINGDLTVHGNIKSASFINNKNVTLLHESCGKILQQISKENVAFKGSVYTNYLEVMQINGIRLDAFQAILNKKWSQEITGYYTFQHIKTENMVAVSANNINIENIINIKNDDISHLSGPQLTLTEPQFMGAISSTYFMCNLSDASHRFHHPNTRHWINVTVVDNVTIFDRNSTLGLVLDECRTINKTKDNIIDAPVIFNHISANNTFFKKHINNINVEEVISNALLKNKRHQVITGHKKFNQLEGEEVFVQRNTEIPVINDIYISDLNSSLVKINELNNGVIRGQKTFFGGLQTTQLLVPSISNVHPNNLVDLNNLRTIPHVKFDMVEVKNDFNIMHVSSINLKNFLSDIFFCDSPQEQILDGTFQFDNIHLHGDTYIKVINDIPISDIVFDKGSQKISGVKYFTGDVNIYGNINVNSLNGYNISQYYGKAILADKNVTFTKDLILNNFTEIKSNIITTHINGVSIEHIKEVLQMEPPKLHAEWVISNIKQLENILVDNFKMIEGLVNKFMYLEMSEDFQINVPDCVYLETVKTGEDLMLHIDFEAPGHFCNLPTVCTCREQQIWYLSHHNRVNSFPTKIGQRVYMHNDDFMSINIVVNSIASSKICRNQGFRYQLENVTIIWSNNSYRNKNSTKMYGIEGHIKYVKFFSIKDSCTYAIICNFYDVTLNVDSQHCLVFKFSASDDNMELIQKISTKTAIPIQLFYSAQGVIQIFGNRNKNETNIQLYRFNFDTQQFNLFHMMPGYDAISAIGISIGKESFIALGERGGFLEILKYNPLYDDYIFYQSVMLDSSILDVNSFTILGFRTSKSYLCAVTEKSHFYIFQNNYAEGWILVSQGKIDGLRGLVPFEHNNNLYLFALSSKNSIVISVVVQSQN